MDPRRHGRPCVRRDRAWVFAEGRDGVRHPDPRRVPDARARVGVAGGFGLALAVAGALGVAWAHPYHTTTGIERYIKLVPGGENGRLVYTITFGDMRALAERMRADANHDGRVSEGERDAYAEQAASRVLRGLELRIDGRPEEIAFESRWVEPLVGPPQPGILTIELRAALPPIGGPGRRVCVHDTNRLDSLVRTELGVEAPAGVVLRRAGTTDPPTALSPYESVPEAPGVVVARVLCAVIDAPAVRPRPARAKWLRSRPMRIGAGVAGALGVLAAVAVAVRRKRRRSR